MFSYELVSDGEYHRVEMLAIKKKFTLRVDGGLARSIVNEGENEFMTGALRQPLFVAGVPSDVGRKSLNSWHLRNATSFNGKYSFENIYISGIFLAKYDYYNF